MAIATAIAHPNIALVKYWGKRDRALNLPAVPSLSLTLDGFSTHTTVTWDAPSDRVLLGGQERTDSFGRKVLAFLDRLDPKRPRVVVDTHNDFPTGAGLASSASGFAALALAASHAAGQDLSLEDLSVLARQGSGSACRSLWGGFVVWQVGSRADGTDSHGAPVAGQDHWDVAMVVAVVADGPKAVGSTEGMERTRDTSPLWDTWVAQAQDDVEVGLAAVRSRDLAALGRVMESSTFKMHATMATADPPLLYAKPETTACIHAVLALRASGVPAYLTMDAGPQVKVLCMREDAEKVVAALAPLATRTHVLGPGEGARLA